MTNAAVAGAAGFGALGAVAAVAAENRSPRAAAGNIYHPTGKTAGRLLGPQYVAEELLHAEGFTDVRYMSFGRRCRRHKRWHATRWIGPWISHRRCIAELDGGAPLTMVAGVHVGVFELFAQDHIRSIADLKGARVGVPPGFATPRHW